MDRDNVIDIFKLFTGEDDAEPFEALVDLAMGETGRMLLPDADDSDVRLDFLSAAIAAYRLAVIYASREKEKYCYAGKAPSKGDSSPLAGAESLLRDYLSLCEGLVDAGTFFFAAISA